MRSIMRSRSWLAILTVMICTVVLSVNGLWIGENGDGWKDTIRSDAKGYYSYLTSTFLRNDLGHEPPAYEYVQHTPNGTLNKYFCGTAIAMAPWFAVGHGLALLDATAPRDGYSAYEMKAISFGGWVYYLLGLLALRAVFLRLGVRDGVIAWLILGLGSATPLLQYVAIQPGWSHVYSFCAISVFLLLVHKLASGDALRLALPAAALFGLIILIRPVNGLVLLAVPIVAGSNTVMLIARLVQRWYILLLSVLIVLLIVGLQSALWHAQTARWFEWGYRNEGFYWDRPMVYEVLIGIRRGLFVWSPFLLLAAGSAFLLWRTDRIRSGFTVLYWIVNTYVISCWWIWYYGSGFASRVYIDHYPVLLIPAAWLLQRAAPRWWTAARVFIVACIGLFLFQYWQYRNDIIHHEHMDAAKYAYTFLKTDDAYRFSLGGRSEEAPYHPNGLELVLTESTDLERPTRYWTGGHLERMDHAFSKDSVCVFDVHRDYGTSFTAPAGIIPPGREVYLKVGFMRYEVLAGEASKALCVTRVSHADGTQGFYNSFRMEPMTGLTDSTWKAIDLRIPVPEMQEGDALHFYLWNQNGEGRFQIDDLMMRVYAVRP